MKIKLNRGAAYTVSGIGIGLVASLAIRAVMGAFVEMSSDNDSMVFLGISGMMLGGYFGFLRSFDEVRVFRSQK